MNISVRASVGEVEGAGVIVGGGYCCERIGRHASLEEMGGGGSVRLGLWWWIVSVMRDYVGHIMECCR